MKRIINFQHVISYKGVLLRIDWWIRITMGLLKTVFLLQNFLVLTSAVEYLRRYTIKKVKKVGEERKWTVPLQ